MFKNMLKDIIKAQNILLNVPRARTLRELARLSGVALSTVQRRLAKLSLYGKLKSIYDDKYFGLTRLAIMFSYSDEFNLTIKHVPIGTMAIRKFKGFGRRLLLITACIPEDLKNRYLEELFSVIDADVVGIVQAKEYVSWKPEERILKLYLSADYKKMMGEVYAKLEDSVNTDKHQQPKRMPDPIDLKILSSQMIFGPYGKILKQLLWLEKYFGEKWNMSKQLISYHYRAHVIHGWKFNTFHFYLPHEKVPFRLYYIVGKEAPLLAKALMILPHSLSAYIENKAAMILAQYPDRMINYIYEIASTAEVELPQGPLIMHLSLERYIPPLWRFMTKNKEKWQWKWPTNNVLTQPLRIKKNF